MQTQKKWVLTLMAALGAVSCGGSTKLEDGYQGFVDATGLDAKFQPNATTCGTTGKDKCYVPVKGSVGGADFSYHNLGYLLSTDKNLVKEPGTGAPALPASAVKATVYDFPEGCAPGKPFDQRTDAYPQDSQFPVFDTLPLTNTATNSLVIPLMHAQAWTGESGVTCNAIKDAQSLTAGKFGGAGSGDSIVLRAVIDLTLVPVQLPAGAAPAAFANEGWYRSLLLAWIDAGPVPVTADSNIGMMDGVWLKPTTTGAKPDATAKLVFQARPGDAAWSPVVRLREIAAPTTGGSPTSLCYTAPTTPCPATSVDMSKPATYTGVLFLAPTTL